MEDGGEASDDGLQGTAVTLDETHRLQQTRRGLCVTEAGGPHQGSLGVLACCLQGRKHNLVFHGSPARARERERDRAQERERGVEERTEEMRSETAES